MEYNEIIKDLKVWVDLSELTEKPPFVTHEFLQQLLDLINRTKAENEDLFYKLTGVMHYVDKWLEGDELKQDEVNRAMLMREKTLQITEKQEAEIERLLSILNQPTEVEHSSLCETVTYKK